MGQVGIQDGELIVPTVNNKRFLIAVFIRDVEFLWPTPFPEYLRGMLDGGIFRPIFGFDPPRFFSLRIKGENQPKGLIPAFFNLFQTPAETQASETTYCHFRLLTRCLSMRNNIDEFLMLAYISTIASRHEPSSGTWENHWNGALWKGSSRVVAAETESVSHQITSR